MDVLQLIDQMINGEKSDRSAAVRTLRRASEEPVTWSYDVWPTVVAGLASPNDHVRAICAQLLCNLAAYSDPEGRIMADLDALLAVTRDPEFFTARLCLYEVWRVGLAGPDRLKLLLAGLEVRQQETAVERNGTLVRYYLQIGLSMLYSRLPTGDAWDVEDIARRWIRDELDPDYRKKYQSVWRPLLL